MTSRRQALTSFLLPALMALAPAFALAQTAPAPEPAPVSSSKALKQTNAIHLGYVRTSSAQINSDAQTGMDALSEALNKKSAVKVDGVVALDLEKDDISFFRFLYWPITPDAQALSEKARQRVQSYIDKGGVILFDLRDAGGSMRDQRALRRVLADINIKPLVALPQNHTLTQTFYRLSGLPGSTVHGDISVEVQGGKGTESVSSVIIGDRNWAGAWAGTTVMPGTREREMALRAGINMVIYAYVGNAKADPIHQVLEHMQR